MKFGTLILNDLSLAYTDTETAGRGPGILLIHGNSGSRGVWAAQLDGELARHARLVALDLPSHGDSAPLPEGDDTLAAMARLVASAADALGLADAILVGHSLGGHLLLEAAGAGWLPHARGLMIHGSPPLSGPADFGRAFNPNPVAMAAFTANPTEAEIDALLAAWFGPKGSPPPSAKVDFLRAHAPIRAQLGSALLSGRMLNERRVVAELKIPLAVLNGDDDPFMNVDYLDELEMPTLWGRRIQSIPGAGHFIQSDRPAAYNTLLAEFAADLAGG